MGFTLFVCAQVFIFGVVTLGLFVMDRLSKTLLGPVAVQVSHSVAVLFKSEAWS